MKPRFYRPVAKKRSLIKWEKSSFKYLLWFVPSLPERFVHSSLRKLLHYKLLCWSVSDYSTLTKDKQSVDEVKGLENKCLYLGTAPWRGSSNIVLSFSLQDYLTSIHQYFTESGMSTYRPPMRGRPNVGHGCPTSAASDCPSCCWTCGR